MNVEKLEREIFSEEEKQKIAEFIKLLMDIGVTPNTLQMMAYDIARNM